MFKDLLNIFKKEPVKDAPTSVKTNSSASEYHSEAYDRWKQHFDFTLSEFEEGKKWLLPRIYEYLTSDNEKIVNKSANAVGDYMSKLDYFDIYRLNDSFRNTTSMDWCIDWKKVEPRLMPIANRENFMWVLRLGTMHPNGYYREKCIRELMCDKESAPYIFIRLNDWVLQVRNAAEEAFMRMPEMSSSEFAACLPFYIRTAEGERISRASLPFFEQKMLKEAEKHKDIFDSRILRLLDVKTRRSVYTFYLNAGLLSKEELNRTLSVERNEQLRALIMSALIKKCDVTIDELDGYLTGKSLRVKLMALEQKYSILKDYWPGLENLLLSKSKSVRGYVRYILERHTQINAAAFYRERLDSTDKKMCIVGLGECGLPEDAELLKVFLSDNENHMVKLVLHAIGLICKEDGADLYRKYLKDSRETVAHQAYREIVAWNVVCGAENLYNLLLETGSELLKEKYVRLLLKEPVWDALPYRLMLYSAEDKAVRNLIRNSSWTIRTYSAIPREKADWIADILNDEKYQIPEKLRKKVLFDMKYAIK